MERAVVLAAGRGTRMRRADPGARLSAEQRAAAELGRKGLMPILGRPFLAHVLEALGAAGVGRACLVAAAGDDELRRRRDELAVRGMELSLAVQAEPRGTADALLASRDWVGGQPFLVLNGDNYYPPEALRELLDAGGPALLALDGEAVAGSPRTNLTARRLRRWAVVEVDAAGRLTRILEKPPPETWAGLARPILVSSNCWRFGPEIFDACARVGPSDRGEQELPAAVQLGVDRLGQAVRVVESRAAVLDLSTRADVAAVEELLARRREGRS